jgi:hypothetical protein
LLLRELIELDLRFRDPALHVKFFLLVGVKLCAAAGNIFFNNTAMHRQGNAFGVDLSRFVAHPHQASCDLLNLVF